MFVSLAEVARSTLTKVRNLFKKVIVSRSEEKQLWIPWVEDDKARKLITNNVVKGLKESAGS